MKLVFDEVSIQKKNNTIVAIDNTNDFMVNCKLTKRNIKWVMGRINENTEFITEESKSLDLDSSTDDFTVISNMVPIPEDVIQAIEEFIRNKKDGESLC